MASYVFQRYELKYILTPTQYAVVKACIDARLSPDTYGETTVQSLYCDTPDFRLVRASVEKPVYKEKLRLRCYGLGTGESEVFLEMKRKYDGVVYKRRISLRENKMQDVLSGGLPASQIGSETAYFLQFYENLSPKMMILYDRAAFFDPMSDLRVTFDKNVRYRTEHLNFHTSLDGEPLLPDGHVLMEIKVGGAIPLWLCEILSRETIRKQSFSKYGSAYEREFSRLHEPRKITEPRRDAVCLHPYFVTELSRQSVSSSS